MDPFDRGWVMGSGGSRRASDSEACVIGDHVYLRLSRSELGRVIQALRGAGELKLEGRLAGILNSVPTEPHGH
jgi:hypothetical protein